MTATPQQRRVVISGLGFITSIGNDKAEVSRSLRELRTGIERFDFIPGGNLPVTVAGTIKDFDTRSDHHSAWRWPARYTLTREMLRSLPPHGVYAACAMQQLIEDARLTPADLASDQTGLFTASAGSPFLQRRFLNSMYESKGDRMFPMGVVSTIAGTLSFNLATQYGVRGAVCGFVSACASSAHAIGYAFDEIALGRLDRVVIVGGEDLTADSTYSFHAARTRRPPRGPLMPRGTASSALAVPPPSCWKPRIRRPRAARRSTAKCSAGDNRRTGSISRRRTPMASASPWRCSAR